MTQAEDTVNAIIIYIDKVLKAPIGYGFCTKCLKNINRLTHYTHTHYTFSSVAGISEKALHNIIIFQGGFGIELRIEY